jgi:integrase
MYHPLDVHAGSRLRQRRFLPLGTKARLALALLLFTGVRRSDVVKLGHHVERDGVLHFT